MKKRFNFRYFLLLIVSLITMILFSYAVLPNLKARVILISILSLVTIALVVLLFIYKRNYLKIILSILIILCTVLFNGIIRENKLNKNYDFDNIDVIITGRICSNYSYTNSENIKVIVDDVKLYSSNDFLNVNGKIILYIEPSNLNLLDLNIGRYIEINGCINFYEFSENYNLSQLSNNIVGYSFCYSSTVMFSDEVKLNLKEKIHNFVYKRLINENLTYSSIATAMIFGDSDLIEDDVIGVFENIGIIHIIAVSGLNISIIVALISFVLDKLKTNSKFKFILISIILAVYMYLCNYSPSVVRASLMSIIYLYAKYNGKPYDKLSSLSFIASLLLFINPLKLFNYSYILSFSTILVIILLMPIIKNMFDKYFYKSFSDSVSLTISVQLGLVFVQLYLFNTIPIFSVLSNILLVPIAEIGFIIILISLPLSFITPIFSLLTSIYDMLMNVMTKLGYLINSLGSIIEISNISFIVMMLYFVLMFIISEFFFESRKNKLFLAINIILICSIVQTLIII